MFSLPSDPRKTASVTPRAGPQPSPDPLAGGAAACGPNALRDYPLDSRRRCCSPGCEKDQLPPSDGGAGPTVTSSDQISIVGPIVNRLDERRTRRAGTWSGRRAQPSRGRRDRVLRGIPRKRFRVPHLRTAICNTNGHRPSTHEMAPPSRLGMSLPGTGGPKLPGPFNRRSAARPSPMIPGKTGSWKWSLGGSQTLPDIPHP